MKFFILLMLMNSLVFANGKGLEIAKEMEVRDSGWGDFTANMKMVLTDRKGRSAIREIRTKNLEVRNDGEKSMSIFDTPRDIKGTAMLTFSHKLNMDDQWLYLPALKRVKRISSRNKSGPFMGSEFAYEDLGSQEVEKYEHIYLGEDRLDGVIVFKNKRIPKYKHTGYKKQIIWIEKDRYIPLKIDFYDRKDSLLKTLTFNNYQQYLGKHWRALEMKVINHQNGKKTKLLWSNYKFNVGLNSADFKSVKLKRLK